MTENQIVEVELAVLAVLQVLIENRNATNAAIESLQSFLRSLRA